MCYSREKWLLRSKTGRLDEMLADDCLLAGRSSEIDSPLLGRPVIMG